MLYKPDWQEAKERYNKWWNGEYFGRPLLWVTAPKDNPPDTPEPEPHTTLKQKWYDIDHNLAWAHYQSGRTFYGAEAFPIWTPGYAGQDSLCSLIGSPLELGETTGWHEPILNDEHIDADSLNVDTEGEAYGWVTEMLTRYAEEAYGRAVVSNGAYGGSGDSLSALRGNERLLYDCMDRPEEVRAADYRLMELWCEEFDRRYEIISECNGGSAGWFPLWAPGKFYAAQNDFSYMISPDMFRDLFLPTVKLQVRHLDYSIYHVDGVAAFAHVDALLEIEQLNALQILPGAGKPSPIHFADVLHKVQDAGKNLHIGIGPDQVEEALSMLSAKGLCIQIRCETENEARELIADAEKWSHA